MKRKESSSNLPRTASGGCLPLVIAPEAPPNMGTGTRRHSQISVGSHRPIGATLGVPTFLRSPG
eukprot:4175370-Alexandrium_andersonii.AAC.1